MRSYLDRTGWTFHVAAGFIALPEPKRAKLWRYIDKLLASHRVNRPDLENAHVGHATVSQYAHLVAIFIS